METDVSDDLKKFFYYAVVVGVVCAFVLAIAKTTSTPYDAAWVRGACVRSHTETNLRLASCGPSLGLDGKFHMDCQAGRTRLVTETICDQYGPNVCRPGSDGVADCAPENSQ